MNFVFTFALCLTSSVALASAPVQHTIHSGGHKLALYEKRPSKPTRTILLIHGRTWSALPNFDLQVPGEKRSLMDALVEKGYAAYALDLPGYGNSPRDKSGWLTPNMAATDLVAALRWIGENSGVSAKPYLFGYSLGATLSQLAVQQHPELVSRLILFGYWRDLGIPVGKDPMVSKVDLAKSGTPLYAKTSPEDAKRDFIVPGSISQRAIDAYALEAVRTTPIKTDYKDWAEFAALDPKKVTVPTLMIQGEMDPSLSTEKLARFFVQLGTGDRQWVMIPSTDHAAHLEELDRFVAAITGL